MAKKKTTNPTSTLEIVDKSTGVAQFEETLEMVTALSEQVQQIKIVDETSLAIANQKLSTVNNHIKLIEEKREKLKAPYFQAGKQIDSTAKELKAPLEASVAYLKTQIIEWNKQVMAKEAELKKKAQEEENLAAEKRLADYLKNVKDWLVDQLAQTTTVEHGTGMLESIKGLQPASVMGKYSQEYSELISSYTLLFTNKIKELSGNAVAGSTENMVTELGGHLAGHIDNISSEVTESHTAAVEAQVEIKQEIVSLENTMASNVRYNWKFEVVDIKQVPMDFLMVDEAKVKEFIKNNKDLLEERTSNGIRFYKEMSVVTK